MKDIDFDELDQAVNQFLGSKKKDNVKPIENVMEKDILENNKSVEFVDSQEEKHEMNSSQEMVFARRQVVSASSFHSGNYPRRVDFTPSLVKKLEKKDEAEEKEENKKLDIHDNFDEKLHREHKNKSVGILDNFKEVKFEEPVLGDEYIIPEILNDDKIFPELKSKYESDISADAFEKNILAKDKNEEQVEDSDKTIIKDSKESVVAEEDKVEVNNEVEISTGTSIEENTINNVEPIREISSRISVPERPGVHQISTDDDMVVFGVTNKKEENSQDEKIEDDADKIAVNFVDKSKEEVLSERTIEVPQISSEPKNVSKILVQTEEEVEGEDNSDVISKEPENSQQTISLDKTSIEDIKTPFVQNAKIEKRPLGAPQTNQVSNFDIKPVDRSREIKRAKLENSPSEAPILSRDEYSTPVVPQKKKSGTWTVVIIMIIMAIFGVGGGFVAWYLLGQ